MGYIGMTMPISLFNLILNSLLLSALLLASGTVFAVDNIRLQGMFSSKAVINIDGKRRVLSIGETSPEGVTLIAIGDDHVTLKIDDSTHDYTMGGSIGLDYVKPENHEEQFFADQQGMFEAVGTINSQTVRFLIDTGATLVAMNRSQAKQLGIRYRLDGQPTSVSTASGFEKAYRVKLKSVTLGNIKQTNVDAMVIDGHHPGPILLGMSFLGQLKVEKAGNTLVLKQRK